MSVKTSSILAMALGLLHVQPMSAQSNVNIVLPECRHRHLACTAEELQRLRQAYQGQGAEHDVVAAHVTDAKRFLGDPIRFPPRGGQHNQWYQCDACQVALRTVDATHHQCPKCKKVYSGPPYDDVIFSHEHSRNLQRMTTAAWAHAISQEQEFARYAARVLLGYAQRYSQYLYHDNSMRDTPGRSGGHLFEQTLNEASCMAASIGPAYDLIHDCNVLSTADHQRIRDGLLLPMLRNIDKNKAGKSNWQTWHNAAMLWGGALLHDPNWVRKAILDERNGFYYQMDASVSKEGMWYENSWGYHFYTLSALINMAETARRLNLDLWGQERLKKMFTLPAYYTMANGMLPRFGDDVNSSVRRLGRMFEPAYHAYRDPQLLALLGDRPSFESVLLGRSTGASAQMPALQSMVFEDAGHAILRSQGPAGLTAAMTFGPYGGFHGHYDKLSFVLFGFGKELGVDPGRAASQAYRLPIHSNWYKATISHNAVLVDGRSQKPASGKLELFERKDGYTAVAASCREAYPGVEHKRLLFMTDTYLLVLDQLHSDTDHRFGWLYHNKGARVVCDQAREGVTIAADYSGGDYIQNARRGESDEPIQARFEDGNVTTHLILAGRPGTLVTIGDGVGASVDDRVPMVMVGRTGRNVSFAALLEPVLTGGRPQVAGIRLTKAANGLVTTVELDGRTDVVRIRRDNGFSADLSQKP
ncbi:MAG: alginate lyase family protein [Sedimentisphaerales bacterium]|nr:alginate lyase family protein [Sedimentisphaerales bacterium]